MPLQDCGRDAVDIPHRSSMRAGSTAAVPCPTSTVSTPGQSLAHGEGPDGHRRRRPHVTPLSPHRTSTKSTLPSPPVLRRKSKQMRSVIAVPVVALGGGLSRLRPGGGGDGAPERLCRHLHQGQPWSFVVPADFPPPTQNGGFIPREAAFRKRAERAGVRRRLSGLRVAMLKNSHRDKAVSLRAHQSVPGWIDRVGVWAVGFHGGSLSSAPPATTRGSRYSAGWWSP